MEILQPPTGPIGVEEFGRMEILQPPTGPIGALCYLPAARTGGALRPPALCYLPAARTGGALRPPAMRGASRDHDRLIHCHHDRHQAYRLHSVQNCGRAAIALLQSRYRMDRTLADTYLSVAIDFNIAQVVDLLKGVHPGSG